MIIVNNFDFEKEYSIALERAKIMIKNGLYSRFNLSRTERVNKAALGCMGELAFEQFLKLKGIEYKTDKGNFVDRKTDEFDFLIEEKKIDVKVARKSTRKVPNDNWTYGYPEEQNPSSKNFIVIGWVDFNKKEVGFYGWITGKKVSTFPVVTKNSYAGYNYLTPNHEFKWGELNKDFDQLFQRTKG